MKHNLTQKHKNIQVNRSKNYVHNAMT